MRFGRKRSIEGQLRAGRPAPPPAFLKTMVSTVEAGQASKRSPARWIAPAFAVALTLLVAAVLGFSGAFNFAKEGTTSAARSLGGFSNVVFSTTGTCDGACALEFPSNTQAPTLTVSPTADPTSQKTATFTFGDTDVTVARAGFFTCVLDGVTTTHCASTVTTPTLADGSHTFSVFATQGGYQSKSAVYTWVVDATKPVISLIQTTTCPNGTNGFCNAADPATISFSVSATDAGTGVTSFACTDNGTAITVASQSGSNPRTGTISVSGDGTHALSCTATDAAGNTSDAVTASVKIDRTSPTATINQAGTQNDPAPRATVNFTATFSEAVTGFTGSDVTTSGTAPGTKAVAVTGGTSTYNAAVSGASSFGTVTASIPAGAATDSAGNPSTAATSTDSTVTLAITASCSAGSGHRNVVSGTSPFSSPAVSIAINVPTTVNTTATPDASGNWSFTTANNQLSNGSYTATATQTVGGVTSTASCPAFTAA